jgi:hypothetical protein
LPDGCTTIDQILDAREGNAFQVTITTLRPANQVCTEALMPFERIIPLDVYGLPAGTYTVIVNGVSDTFQLAVDNVPQTEEPSPANIGGQVWHDLCSPPWGDTPPAPPAGCVEAAGGGYQANGILEAGEPGISGVQVQLGAGACPSTGLATAITAGDGTYTFAGLAAGAYCVSIDQLDAVNEGVLIPGEFTYPPPGVGEVTVALAGVDQLSVNFGWDYQFAP